MYMKARTPAPLWQWAYIFVNAAALMIMLSTGEMMGDAQGLVVQNPGRLIVAFLAVVAAYWIVLGPGFSLTSRFPVKGMKFGRQVEKVDDRLGVFLIAAQISFFLFNILNGVNVAGSANVRTDSALSLIWVIVPVDSLFLIYYAVARDKRLFWPNFAIYVISNVMRGWLGIFLFVIFLEMCRATRSRKIRWSRLVAVVCVVLVFYPVMLNLKWLLRAAGANESSILDGIGGVVQSLSANDYLDIIGAGVTQIVGRLQITSSVEEVIRYSSQLQSAFNHGTFKPFWLEGLHGIVYDRLMYNENRPAIGVAFTSIGEFGGDFDVGSWNTNTGWVGWFFISPLWAPFLLFYTAMLCYLSLFFAKKIGMSSLLKDLVWFAWLVFLIPGWLGAFVGFIYALVLFLFLKWAFSVTPSVKLS